MDALKRPAECFYYPVDGQPEHAGRWPRPGPKTKTSNGRHQSRHFEPHAPGVCGDAADPPRLFVFSGNTMGSFDPLAGLVMLSRETRLLVERRGVSSGIDPGAARQSGRAAVHLRPAGGSRYQRADGENPVNLRTIPATPAAPGHASFSGQPGPVGDRPSQEISLERGERIG